MAMWQASYVADALHAQGLQTEMVPIETTGDKMLNKTIAKIGSKGVFTEELEEQLRQGQIDVAVHSAKDLPSALAPDLSIIAFTEREQVHDVLVSYNQYFTFDESQKLVFGTSSTRRVAMIRHYYPKIKAVDVRGNLQTRMRKMEEGLCDALVLAYAGVHRMGYDEFIVAHLPVDTFTPAVGQGSIAVQVADNLAPELAQLIRQAVNHPLTECQITAERAFLRQLEGGCSVPAFALATPAENGQLDMHAGLISLNGKEIVRVSQTAALGQAEQLGQTIAEQVLAQGGEAMLREIKKHIA